MICRLCGDTLPTAPGVLAPETRYGTGEYFEYRRCSNCGSQLLVSIPADLSPYYPPDYYSYETWDPPSPSSPATRLRRIRLAVALRIPVTVSDWLGARQYIPHYVRWFAGLTVRPDTPILDVGSGGGHLLVNMATQGFSDLLGVDPFMQQERSTGPVRLLRREINELEETFGIVMINHTLEHVENPREFLKASSDRLRLGGHLIVRVPAYDSWVAQHYGTDWIGWEPPRHLQLPTTRALRIVCESAGLRVVRQFRDGHAYGFWGSEQFRMGIAVQDPRSWAEDPSRSSFTKDQIDRWERRARELNALGAGDAVTFVLARERAP